MASVFKAPFRFFPLGFVFASRFFFCARAGENVVKSEKTKRDFESTGACQLKTNRRHVRTHGGTHGGGGLLLLLLPPQLALQLLLPASREMWGALALLVRWAFGRSGNEKSEKSRN